jgi:hypothetical protein
MFMWFRENLYLLSSLITLFEGGVKKDDLSFVSESRNVPIFSLRIF